MKVALVCPYGLDHHGGVQDQVMRLRRWLADAGHEPWIVAPGTDGPAGTRYVGGSTRVRANRSRVPVALDPRAIRRTAGAVSDADVVHIHEPFMPLVSISALLATTPPKVGTFHADPSTAVRRFYGIGGRLFAAWSRRLSVATAVSSLAQSAVADLAETRIVPNGIDVASYAGNGARHPGRVVFLGRDDPRKGLDVLLAAWPGVAAEVPDAELVVVGADRASGPERTTFTGRVGEEDKRRHLRSAAVYCAPNTGGESFGIVVAEGMAAGCAVVASAIPAFVAVADGAAELVPPDDPPALAQALTALLSQPARIAALAAQASARAADFDRGPVLAGYLAAYEDAANRG